MLDVTFVKRGGRSALGFLQATPLRVKGHTVQGAHGRLQADPRVLMFDVVLIDDDPRNKENREARIAGRAQQPPQKLSVRRSRVQRGRSDADPARDSFISLDYYPCLQVLMRLETLCFVNTFMAQAWARLPELLARLQSAAAQSADDWHLFVPASARQQRLVLKLQQTVATLHSSRAAFNTQRKQLEDAKANAAAAGIADDAADGDDAQQQIVDLQSAFSKQRQQQSAAMLRALLAVASPQLLATDPVTQAISHWATLKLGEDLCERKAQVFDRTRVEMTLEMESVLDQDEQARKHRLRQRRAEAEERARDAAAEEKLLDMVDDADEPSRQGSELAIAIRPRGRGDSERAADGERKRAPAADVELPADDDAEWPARFEAVAKQWADRKHTAKDEKRRELKTRAASAWTDAMRALGISTLSVQGQQQLGDLKAEAEHGAQPLFATQAMALFQNMLDHMDAEKARSLRYSSLDPDTWGKASGKTGRMLLALDMARDANTLPRETDRKPGSWEYRAEPAAEVKADGKAAAPAAVDPARLVLAALRRREHRANGDRDTIVTRRIYANFTWTEGRDENQDSREDIKQPLPRRALQVVRGAREAQPPAAMPAPRAQLPDDRPAESSPPPPGDQQRQAEPPGPARVPAELLPRPQASPVAMMVSPAPAAPPVQLPGALPRACLCLSELPGPGIQVQQSLRKEDVDGRARSLPMDTGDESTFAVETELESRTLSCSF